MTNFMADRAGAGERYDREGLVRWASGRFNAHLSVAEVESKPRSEIAQMLFELSQKFLERGTAIDQLNSYLDKAYGSSNGVAPGAKVAKVECAVDPKGLQNLIDWANEEFQSSLDAKELEKSSREAVEKAVRVGFERRFRPELYQTERSLILEILDTAWKDHLYYMDHLRAGIGLVGYAQKDPKVEYRREGMRAFEQMWDRIGGQVTSAIFRIENQSPEFVGSLWRISTATHAAPEAVEAEPQQQTTSSGSGSKGPGEVQAVETIRNFGDKVGRNDPCPCGSGKKYKKCCGLNS